jgi:hypothetical protein
LENRHHFYKAQQQTPAKKIRQENKVVKGEVHLKVPTCDLCTDLRNYQIGAILPE